MHGFTYNRCNKKIVLKKNKIKMSIRSTCGRRHHFLRRQFMRWYRGVHGNRRLSVLKSNYLPLSFEAGKCMDNELLPMASRSM